MRATRPGSPPALAARHWCTAPCSESTGTICPAPGRASTARTTGPPAISDSLLARASRRPAASVANVSRRPAKPTTPLTQTSATVPISARASTPAWTSVPGGTASATSAARRSSPDDHQLGVQVVGLGHQPVDRRPRPERDHLEAVGLGPHHVDGLGADRPGRTGHGDGRHGHARKGTCRLSGDRGVVPQVRKKSLMRARYHTAGSTKSRASNRSSRPPWPGQDAAHVLDAQVALDQRLGQVAERGDQGDEDAELQALLPAVERVHTHGWRTRPRPRRRAACRPPGPRSSCSGSPPTAAATRRCAPRTGRRRRSRSSG